MPAVRIYKFGFYENDEGQPDFLVTEVSTSDPYYFARALETLADQIREDADEFAERLQALQREQRSQEAMRKLLGEENAERFKEAFTQLGHAVGRAVASSAEAKVRASGNEETSVGSDA